MLKVTYTDMILTGNDVSREDDDSDSDIDWMSLSLGLKLWFSWIGLPLTLTDNRLGRDMAEWVWHLCKR